MQPSFFDQENRLAQLEKPGDPLPLLESIVDWNDFKPLLKKIQQKKRKSKAGRKPYNVILMFKMLVLQSLYNLSDDQAEFQARDRLSFQRFLGFSPEDRVAEAKTPEGREEQPHMKCQKDLDALWTKKQGKSYYGYKNHINIDKQGKLIRRYKVTDASVHDSRVFEEILLTQHQYMSYSGLQVCSGTRRRAQARVIPLSSTATQSRPYIIAGLIDEENSGRSIWAHSACRSREREKQLADASYNSRIQHKGNRNKSLVKQQQASNRFRSKTRAGVEHVVGDRSNTQGGILVRTKGMVRAAVKIRMMNLTYRLKFLLRGQSVSVYRIMVQKRLDSG